MKLACTLGSAYVPGFVELYQVFLLGDKKQSKDIHAYHAPMCSLAIGDSTQSLSVTSWVKVMSLSYFPSCDGICTDGKLALADISTRSMLESFTGNTSHVSSLYRHVYMSW